MLLHRVGPSSDDVSCAVCVVGEDCDSPDDAACEEICALYYAEGDPTGGHRSQNATLFADQGAAVFELECPGGGTIAVAQQSDRLRLAGVTGCVVWNGAVVLARSLEAWTGSGGPLSLLGASVVELGAGTGVLALACAALGARVVATEQEERLKLLRRNLERHGEGLEAPWSVGRRGGSVDLEELDWFSPGLPLHCDLVVASDVVYTEEVTEALVKCLSAYAAPAIVCVELRTEEVHYCFIRAVADAGFTMHRLPAEAHAIGFRSPRVVTYVLTGGGRGNDGAGTRGL